MEKSRETAAQRRNRLAELAGRRMKAFMGKTMKLADKHGIQLKLVFAVMLQCGIPTGNLKEWRKTADVVAAKLGIAAPDWTAFMEAITEMIVTLMASSQQAH